MTSSPASAAGAAAALGLPELVPVPPGPLPPAPGGSAPGGPARGAPARTGGFRLAVLPTTVGQYWASLLDRGLHRGPAPLLHGFPAAAGTGLRTTAAGSVVLDEALALLPVTGVTWHGARAYCAWLGERTGAPHRLPSAAEWQYAAAGPERLRWSLGDAFDRGTYAPEASGPRPVGCTPANAFGLRDMTGNVFEWCADELLAPARAGSPARGLGSRVLKGGAYTVRNPESFENSTAFTADEFSAVPYIGFRVLSE
ncbi:SUMF1/EgtB/PvdO family nonheme iron enzyme [Streptomyces xanthophaeus]|uniref:formylglycine-generating enzyme family protein n=1 Tax=Streptomyces xanthophaeus TaxID=67385 RepID=UPI00343ABC45